MFKSNNGKYIGCWNMLLLFHAFGSFNSKAKAANDWMIYFSSKVVVKRVSQTLHYTTFLDSRQMQPQLFLRKLQKQLPSIKFLMEVAMFWSSVFISLGVVGSWIFYMILMFWVFFLKHLRKLIRTLNSS